MKRMGVLAFSERGMALGERIRGCFTGAAWEVLLTRCPEGGLSDWTGTHFMRDDALVFIGSCGIAVRAVAPYVKSKAEDPAVVAVDELGHFSVALLSGHLGGANGLAEELARFTGAIPVVTTATDVNGVFAVDAWAKSQGLAVSGPERIKGVSARLLRGETIRIRSRLPVAGSPPRGVELAGEEGACDVLVSYRAEDGGAALRLVPRVVTAGVGCRRGVSAEAVEAAFDRAVQKAGCHPLSVCRVCSVDRKADEPGILDFCRRRGLPYETFSAARLASAGGDFTPSAFVESVTGVDNVCERAAVLGSGGRLLLKKQAGGGVTLALAIQEPCLSFEVKA